MLARIQTPSDVRNINSDIPSSNVLDFRSQDPKSNNTKNPNKTFKEPDSNGHVQPNFLTICMIRETHADSFIAHDEMVPASYHDENSQDDVHQQEKFIVGLSEVKTASKGGDDGENKSHRTPTSPIRGTKVLRPS